MSMFTLESTLTENQPEKITFLSTIWLYNCCQIHLNYCWQTVLHILVVLHLCIFTIPIAYIENSWLWMLPCWPLSELTWLEFGFHEIIIWLLTGLRHIGGQAVGGGPGVKIWRLSINLTLQVHPTCSGLESEIQIIQPTKEFNEKCRMENI